MEEVGRDEPARKGARAAVRNAAGDRIKEQKTEYGFGGGAGQKWERVRDLEEGETPPAGSTPAGIDEPNHDWEQVPS